MFAINKDASVRYAKLKANECQIMPYPNPADLPAMKKDPDLKVLDQPGLNIGYLAFNTMKKPFDDKRVRQAINYAVNKAAILEAVYPGVGIAAKNPIPPSMWSYNDDVKDYPYDPEKAPRSCSPRRALPTASRPISGGCRCNVPITPTPSASPS